MPLHGVIKAIMVLSQGEEQRIARQLPPDMCYGKSVEGNANTLPRAACPMAAGVCGDVCPYRELFVQELRNLMAIEEERAQNARVWPFIPEKEPSSYVLEH